MYNSREFPKKIRFVTLLLLIAGVAILFIDAVPDFIAGLVYGLCIGLLIGEIVFKFSGKNRSAQV